MADYSQLGYEPAPAAPPAGSSAYADLGYEAAGAPDDAAGQKKVQGSVSKFMGEIWNQTGGAIGQTVKRVSGWDDWMKAGDQMKAGDYAGAGTTLLQMGADPGHLAGDMLATSKDQVERAGKALKEGRYHDAALHINAAIPVVGTAFASGVNGLDRMAAGEHAEGAADVVSNFGMLALPGAVEEAAGRAAPKVSAGLKRAAPVVKAAVEAGAPDIAMGALKTGVGLAADAAGVPSHVGALMGAREGVPQMARGVAKGFKAGRQVITDRQVPPALPAEPPPLPAEARPPDVPRAPGQDPAAVEPRTPQFDTSLELTPEQEAKITAKYADLGYEPAPQPGTNQPPEATPAPQPETIVPPEATPAPAPETIAQPVTQPAQQPLAETPYEHATAPEPGGKPDYQAAARTVKGRAMGRFLTNPPEGPPITAEEATRMTPEQWQIVAREAGVAAKTAPSIETQKLAIAHMREIEARRSQGRLPGSTTPDTGGQPAAGATLPDDGQGAPEPIETSKPGTGSEGVPLQAAATPGSGPGAGATEVEIPGEGRSLPAVYRLRELADVQPSHNGLTFQPNPRYSLVNDRP